MKEYEINYEGRKVSFRLPSSWQVIKFEEGPSSELFSDPHFEIRSSLENPIHSERLESLAKKSSEALIIFDDLQRQTPCDLIIPEIIERLKKGGLREDRIRLLCASGTHPVLSKEELEKKVGREIFQLFRDRIFTHDPFGECVFIGRTKSGVPIEINRILHEADLIIGIGSCMPHPEAGFGGGYKIIMPGVTSYETTEKHHLTWLRNKGSRVGLLKGNPFHEDIEEAGKLSGLSFKIDVICDEEGKVIRVFSGNPSFVHRKASSFSKSIHGISIPKPSDITITSAFPLEIGVQAMKALLLARYCTKTGGIIIWIAPHRKTGGIDPLIKEMAKDIDATRYHSLLLKEGIPSHLKGLGVSYVLQIVRFKELKERFKVIHVTEGLEEKEVLNMGFYYAPNLDEAIKMASEMKKEAEVLIFPSGGNILPILE